MRRRIRYRSTPDPAALTAVPIIGAAALRRRLQRRHRQAAASHNGLRAAHVFSAPDVKGYQRSLPSHKRGPGDPWWCRRPLPLRPAAAIRGYDDRPHQWSDRLL
jgi:hypothetical protein